jgi:hypothetical protein
MTEETLDPNYDPANDEMRFPYPFVGEPDCEVRVPRSALVFGIPWIKERVEGLLHRSPKT